MDYLGWKHRSGCSPVTQRKAYFLVECYGQLVRYSDWRSESLLIAKMPDEEYVPVKFKGHYSW